MNRGPKHISRVRDIPLEGPDSQTVTRPPQRRIQFVFLGLLVVVLLGGLVTLVHWIPETRAAVARALSGY